MTGNDLEEQNSADTLLTTDGGVERLLSLMRQWWSGCTLSEMAKAHSLSRQRVHAILARVSCTRRLWWQARHERGDAARRAPKQHETEARLILSSPLSACLTARQRCAVAWQAMGLVSLDIATRMAATGQTVRRLLAAARWRMERAAARTAKSKDSGAPLDMSVLDGCDVSGLLAGQTPLISPPASTEAPAEAATASANAAPVPPQPQADDVTEKPPAESTPSAVAVPLNEGAEVPAMPPGDAPPPAKPDEPVKTEQERDVYVERYGNPEGPDSGPEAPSSQSQKPRLRLSELQREKRGW